ncbi:MAG TPA: ABC transporter permease [Gaiellaceae bacterium]|nr:ABC transporter permease [Gaiellaceae bacterium]
MRVPVARRQLFARRGRTLAGLAGIAVALLLVLALKAIFAGMEERLTVYIDGSGADVFVAQRGVETMHMTESALPASAVREVAAVPGVAAARGVLFVSAIVEYGERTSVAYLIADPGRPAPPSGGILVDRSLGAPVGSTVAALGRSFRVTGLLEGTASIASSVAFVRSDDLARLIGSEGLVSYVLVRAAPGVGSELLAERIERAVSAVTASTWEAFARSERRVVSDMATDIVRAMILVGFVIGVAVAGLVAYSATLAQLRDFAVLRALGLRARGALALVLAQVGALVGAGFALALLLVWLLALVLPELSPTLTLAIRAADVAQALVVAAAVTALAASFPVVRVARVDPASVFRR